MHRVPLLALVLLVAGLIMLDMVMQRNVAISDDDDDDLGIPERIACPRFEIKWDDCPSDSP